MSNSAQANVTRESRLALQPISVVEHGDAFLVGDPARSAFFAVPEVGVVALRALQSGARIADAETAAEAYAGQHVDVLDFAEVLVAAGLVESVDGRPIALDSASADATGGFIEGVRPELVRPFFSRPAWCLYALLLAACLIAFARRPELRPTFEAIFFLADPAASVVAGAVIGLLLGVCHEACHWLAARASGVGARFSVSRRLFLPVLETDLSQLWAVPRSQRWSPFLAGMAFDTVVLAAALGVRLAWNEGLIDPPPLAVRLAGAVVLLQVIALAFQTLVFLRTDLYAVLVTALGCFNLYRVSALVLRRRLRVLRPAEAAELAAAHPRDRRVANWFAALSLLGVAAAAWMFVVWFVPATVITAGWLFASLGGAPLGSTSFWQALALGSVAGLQAIVPLVIFTRERLRG